MTFTAVKRRPSRRDMLVHLVNLDSRPDRLEHMAAALNRAGLPFERIAATDGRDPQVAARAAALGPSWNGKPISAAAYGCFQSQRHAWQRILEGGHSHGMVFEDDLHLAGDLSFLADSAWVPADADIVKLETFGTRAHLARREAARVGPRRLVRLRSTHVGAGAYVVSARAAQTLLQRTETITDPVDELLFNDRLGWFEGAITYQMCPAPAIQDKRRAPGLGPSVSWGASSILERAAGGDNVRRETKAERLLRRLREEARACLRQTHYTVVSFG